MVLRRSTQSVTQRSTRQSELHMTRRPRRLVAPKTVDDAVGLSRKEERELKKALYASLQDWRRPRTPVPGEVGYTHTQLPKLRKSTRTVPPVSSHPPSKAKVERSESAPPSLEESSQDSVMSTLAVSQERKKKIQAQRKFAQGCSLPPSPCTTPSKKAVTSPHSLLDKIPKTEDFLTFLCLRGSHLLPANLDFFNFARDESSLEDNHCGGVGGDPGVSSNQMRESTPESSSSGSNVQDELMEITTPRSTPSRRHDLSKAARASAGTPETARGIISLRQGLTRKVVHSGSTRPSQHSRRQLYTPDKTPSPCRTPLAFGYFTPAKKLPSKTCLPPSVLRSSPAGKLALGRNGNAGGLTKLSASPSPLGWSKGRGGEKSGSERQRQRPSTSSFTGAQTKSKNDSRTASTSSKKTPETVRKNLSRPDASRTSPKAAKPPERNREDRARNRALVQKRLASKPSAKARRARKPERRPAKPVKRPMRRSSVRLKTLAKELGGQRPNYSLLLSGYAHLHECQQEQKQKAARSALVKAKAQVRARATASKSGQTKRAAVKREIEKMRTRSCSAGKEEKGAGLRESGAGASSKRTVVASRDSAPQTPDPAPLGSLSESKRLRKDKDAVKPARSASSKEATTRKASPIAASPSPPKKPRKLSPDKGVSSATVAPDAGLSDMEHVPTFHPSESEFNDPISYVESIRSRAQPYGMCVIVPPPSWKMESRVNEEIRFTTQTQHLHRLAKRWGPSVQQTRAILHHLHQASNTTNNPCNPQIGGVEVDLARLYHMIRDLGGLQNIADKKQWVKVADAMKIPKTNQDRVTRLYDVYCKFVLPYAMLSDGEREEVHRAVETQHRQASQEEDAIFKGKSMTLGTFSRVARNIQSMWFQEDPSLEKVEGAYWQLLEDAQSHVSVQCAHVNTRTQSTAFPQRRESPYFRHSWNLNNLPNNKKCILKCLGPVAGTTIPTLHVAMLFSSSCWSTDLHRLPYLHYLHSGATTLWYCVPRSDVDKLHAAMKEECPSLLHDSPLWLSEDTAMVKPDKLMKRGVRVVRCAQQPRQFVLVFPDVYTATVSCGYSVSESVHFANVQWLAVSTQVAKEIRDSGEKELFSVDTLVCGLCQDSNHAPTLSTALPLLQAIVSRELSERRQLSAAGLKCERRLSVEESPGSSASVARKRSQDLAPDSACEVCSRICYLSMVLNERDEQILCLEHGLKHVQRKRHAKGAKLFYRYTQEELIQLLQSTKERLTALSTGAAPAKKRVLKQADSQS